MMFSINSMGQAAELFREVQNPQMFSSTMYALQKYMKSMGMDSRYLLELEKHAIAIGKVLKLSPPFPPLHTGHATFIAPGVPSNQLTTLHRGSTLYALAVHIVLTNFTYFCTSESSLIPFRLHSVVLGRY